MPDRASAAEFLARHLAALDGELPGLLLRVSRQTDGEAIHDLRVTIRRLRTLLRLARPIFGRHHTDLIRAIYTKIAQTSGALRDEEVFLEHLEKYGDGVTAAGEERQPLADQLEAFTAERRAREKRLRGDVTRSLETEDVSRARTMLGALLLLPVRPKKDRELGRFARKAVIDALAGVDRYRDSKSNDIEGLHELRIAYKRLRYTLEFFAPVLPPDLTASHDPAVRFQKRLGDIHDLDMALAHLDERAHAAAAKGVRDPLPREREEQGERESAPATLQPETLLLNALRDAFTGARLKKMAQFESEMRPELPAPPAGS